MTTEVVLLLGIFVFIVGGLFFGEKGPIRVYEKSGPRLAARVEKQLATGRGFTPDNGKPVRFVAPAKAPSTGAL